MNEEIIEKMVERIMRQLNGSKYEDYTNKEIREKYRKILQEQKKESEK